MCIFCVLGSVNPLLKEYPKIGDELPPFDLTFFLPDVTNRNKTQKNLAEILIDEEAYKHIPIQVKQIIKNQDTIFFPLRTEGDGNCLLRAISRAMWGTEDWHEILRRKMFSEITNNENFYKKYFAQTGFTNEELDEIEDDWKIVIKQAKGDGSYLQAIHIFALSNLIKRPIILYAPDNDIDNFGIGATGVAGTFVPIRYDPIKCSSKIPLAICWSSSFKNHFVPIVGFSGKPTPSWPIIQSAYITITNEKLKEYIHIEKKVLDHNHHVTTKHLDDSMIEPKTNIVPRNCHMEELEGMNDNSHLIINLESLTAYECQITFPKGINVSKKLEQILKPFDFEDWKLPRLKKLLINFSTRSDLDGSRLKKEPSFICPCGYKHLVDNKSYDLYMDIRDCGIGWNYGENEIHIAERFFEKYPFEPDFRLQVILAVKKKNEMVRIKLLPSDPSDEEKISIRMSCSRCDSVLTFPKLQVELSCQHCKHTFENPQGIIKKDCPFDECEGKMIFVTGKIYVSCDTCKKTIIIFGCNKCHNSTGAPVEEAKNKEFVPCMTCGNKMITPFHSVCKRPKPLFPITEFVFTKSFNSEQLVNIIKKLSVKVTGTYGFTEKDLLVLSDLAPKIINEKTFFTQDEIDLFINKMFFWEFPTIVPCIDLFKILLLNSASYKLLSKLNFAERADLLIEIAFRYKKEKDSWKIFLVTSQCLVNNFALHDKVNNGTYFKNLDNVLKYIDYCLETKNPKIFVQISKILLNLSVIPSKYATFEARNQISTFLIINVFPILLSMREDLVKQTLKLGPKPTTEIEDLNTKKIFNDLSTNLNSINEALFALFVSLGNILFAETSLVKSLNENGISSLIEQVFHWGTLIEKSWEDPFKFKVENSILEIILK
eukprot:TRINITY_DN4242_c0_g1_i1.p1 TRINITY_DN4242_c0_g1~~TRINITY_DN4242_c0_g1_i1.p1  ORF type:complete len:883 (+),score=245.90 TRINITY_DN4242_c0_g1_i1:161-2809(+)